MAKREPFDVDRELLQLARNSAQSMLTAVRKLSVVFGAKGSKHEGQSDREAFIEEWNNADTEFLVDVLVDVEYFYHS